MSEEPGQVTASQGKLGAAPRQVITCRVMDLFSAQPSVQCLVRYKTRIAVASPLTRCHEKPKTQFSMVKAKLVSSSQNESQSVVRHRPFLAKRG